MEGRREEGRDGRRKREVGGGIYKDRSGIDRKKKMFEEEKKERKKEGRNETPDLHRNITSCSR